MKITKTQIEEIFKRATIQSDALFDLYRIAFPNFDDIKKVNGFPEIGKEANDLIWHKFMEFDRVNHPNVVSGGLWMNHGFSTNKALGPWEIDPSKVNYEIESS